MHSHYDVGTTSLLQLEKDFLKSLAEAFGVSSQGTRAGVVTFSSKAKHSIKLKDHKNVDSFKAAVDGIPLMGFRTRIDRGTLFLFVRLQHVDRVCAKRVIHPLETYFVGNCIAKIW